MQFLLCTQFTWSGVGCVGMGYVHRALGGSRKTNNERERGERQRIKRGRERKRKTVGRERKMDR